MGGIAWNEISRKANGGTELLARELEKRMPIELMDEFQIIPSRMRDLDSTKLRIYWAHDLPGDPEADNAMGNGGWSRFHKLVFVSNWQMQGYIARYGISWAKCVVLHNAINPIPQHEKPTDVIRLIYTSTPHRGLTLLHPVFVKLAEEYDNIVLDVCSSFGLYGWADRDQEFADLFAALSDHPRINWYGAVSNDEVRERLQQAHIFAYPSTWLETSCLCLMEAMSAGLFCVHPNYGALFETSANWTHQYQWLEDPNHHAGLFYTLMKAVIEAVKDQKGAPQLSSQKSYTDVYYSWDIRQTQWEALLKSLLSEPRDLQEAPSEGVFTYRS